MTTTGSTVMTGLDDLPHSILLWRSTVQWIGGIGIIGLAIVILPFLKIGGMQLFRLESSDRTEKAMPRVRGIAAAIGQIYLTLTIACFLAYWALGMTPFDALNHAFTTLCTGGFSTHDAPSATTRAARCNGPGRSSWRRAACRFSPSCSWRAAAALRDRLEPQIVAYIFTLILATLPLAAWLYFAHGDSAGARADPGGLQPRLGHHHDRLLLDRLSDLGCVRRSAGSSSSPRSAGAPDRPPAASRSSASR